MTNQVKQIAGQGRSVGSPPWNMGDTSENNITLSDNIRSSCQVPDGGSSGTLIASHFGFHIPPDSVLEGVIVWVERRSPTSNSIIMDDTISLVDDQGELVGDNKADLVNYWPITEATKKYGSSSDLWNADLTLGIVNSEGFGVALKVTNSLDEARYCGVDAIWIEIYYVPPEAHTPSERRHPEGTILKQQKSGKLLHKVRCWK